MCEPIDFSVTPWMKIAAMELGEREIPGGAHNRRILGYWEEAAASWHAGTDEDAWCSVFVGRCLRLAGYAVTGSAAALSWATYGIPLERPVYGCVSVFWRVEPTSKLGHVNFFLRESGIHTYRGIGGNQQNSVCGLDYPVTRLLCHVWPVLARG
jgi:uncharacterized protein (TIGR02594 family)